jgi:hypothetical protein
MCDAGYKVLFEEVNAKIIEGGIKINGKIVMQGQRDRYAGLWTIPLENTRMSVMTQQYRKYKMGSVTTYMKYQISMMQDNTYMPRRSPQ